MSYLPAILMEIKERFGMEAAHEFGKRFGGLRIYVPKVAGKRHPIAQAIGLEGMRWLADGYGGEHLDIPPGQNSAFLRLWRTIDGMIEEGYSANYIARFVGCSRKSVIRRKARLIEKKGPLPLPLFQQQDKVA